MLLFTFMLILAVQNQGQEQQTEKASVFIELGKAQKSVSALV